MNFQYSFFLDVPVDKAWAVLMDVRRVAPCLPGASIESGEGNNYVGRVKVKLGPIEQTYRGDVVFVERDDIARHAVINVAAKEVKGGGAAKATLTLDVASSGNQAQVTVNSEFTVSGKAAQFGRGVMEEVGEKLMSEFALRLSRLIATDTAANTSDKAQEHTTGTLTTDVLAAAASVHGGAAAVAQGHIPSPSVAGMGDENVMDLAAAVRGPLIKRAVMGCILIGVIVAVAYVTHFR